MHDTDLGRPLFDILSRVAKELEDAAASVEDLHVLVDASFKETEREDILFREAQTIDILQQHLFALADFVSQISEVTPTSWLVESRDAMGNVKLSRLRERLSQIHMAYESREDVSCGDLQLL